MAVCGVPAMPLPAQGSTVQPLVSCLMVTRNRLRLARRALQCFARQSWQHKELVVVDDGEHDYEPILAPYRGRWPIRYHRTHVEPGRFLGGLRNVSMDLAEGEYLMQWDDDEWYHPSRIEVQMQALGPDLDAVMLRQTLMHLDAPEYVERPYRTELRRGTPGTLLHRRTALRYPNLARAEDTAFVRLLRREMRVGGVRGPHSHLFIRCFHGTNTWDRKHFTERLHRTWRDKLHYFSARVLRGDLFTHAAFRLTAPEQESARQFLKDSRELGLLSS
jgi:glycosyltransferase involved in cell wall biosynthesis